MHLQGKYKKVQKKKEELHAFQRFLRSLEPDRFLRFLRAGLPSDELLLLLDEEESESSDELLLLLLEELLLESDDDESDDELFALDFLFLSRSIRLITLEIDSWFSRISLFISLMVSFSFSSLSCSFRARSIVFSSLTFSLAFSLAFSAPSTGSSHGFSTGSSPVFISCSIGLFSFDSLQEKVAERTKKLVQKNPFQIQLVHMLSTYSMLSTIFGSSSFFS